MKMYDVSSWVEPPKQWPLERNKRGEPKKEDLFLFSKYVLQTLESFLASEDQEIDLDHLPICSSSDIRSPVEKYQQAVSAVLGAEVVDWKPLYWTCYINVALFWRDVVWSIVIWSIHHAVFIGQDLSTRTLSSLCYCGKDDVLDHISDLHVHEHMYTLFYL